MFKDIDLKWWKSYTKKMEELNEVHVPRKMHPWKEWFAWRPVKVHGKRVWLKRVYRRRPAHWSVEYDNWKRYEYGTVFDVLKDAE